MASRGSRALEAATDWPGQGCPATQLWNGQTTTRAKLGLVCGCVAGVPKVTDLPRRRSTVRYPGIEMRRLSTKGSTPKVIDSQEDDLLGLNSSAFWTRSALSCLSLLAVLKLGSEFYRLVWETGSLGAIDLAQRHSESLIWFSGQTLYGVIGHAVYPPASQLILGPLVGWENFQFVRWLWALLSALSLIWLC